MLVFLIGVGLLVYVFYIAYGLFTAKSDAVLGLNFTGDPKNYPAAIVIGTRFGWLLLRVGFLFVMSIASSLLSQKGINLYFSAVQGHAVNLTEKKTNASAIVSAEAR